MDATFSLRGSLREAEQRLGAPQAGRRRRSDRGTFRLTEPVREILDALLGGDERPATRTLLRDLAERCRSVRAPIPSRATVYNYMARGRGPTLRLGDLPAEVQTALHNLEPDSLVPEEQVAFEALNRGDLRAIMWASGLPWLALYRAERQRGWRPRSRGLSRAVCAARGI